MDFSGVHTRGVHSSFVNKVKQMHFILKDNC